MSRRIRRAITLLVATALVCLLAALGVRDWAAAQLQAVDPKSSQPVYVKIPPGVSTREMAEILKARGLVKNPLVFRYYARYLKLDSQLKGGEYALSASLNVSQILQKLSAGEVYVRRFTVPEGLTVVQTADVLAKAGVVDKQKFLAAAAEATLADKYGAPHVAGGQPLEGYLFPSTYDYRPGIAPDELLEMMFAGFEKVFTPDLRKRADELHLTVHQTVTLASIIEKEAEVAKERATISGVYHNRLQIGMKLDADPTVRYGIGKPPQEPLLYKDLDVESPYNTYRNAGLPPGPIAAPGEASIKAALYPEKHDFWYFVAKEDGSGEHFFAKTLAEQESNTDKAAANLAAAAKK